jgi:hypothetical protein
MQRIIAIVPVVKAVAVKNAIKYLADSRRIA